MRRHLQRNRLDRKTRRSRKDAKMETDQTDKDPGTASFFPTSAEIAKRSLVNAPKLPGKKPRLFDSPAIDATGFGSDNSNTFEQIEAYLQSPMRTGRPYSCL